MMKVFQKAHQAVDFATGAQNVSLGMHLIFTADNSGPNGSIAQAALSIAQAQPHLGDLLQAQGLFT